MPTPIKWQDALQANPGDAATGIQVDPRIIGLASGDFLVVWTESASGIIGSGAGSNIIGQYYDRFGTRVNDPFQINSRSTIDDERDCDIAATSDGGFVIVYVDDDISQVNQTAIIWERYDIAGNVVVSATIAAENVAADFLGNPQVTVNQLTNESLVTFTDDVGADTDILAVTISAAGVVGAEFDAAQNGADFNGEGDVAILANGNFVSVYRETDGAVTSAEARIMTSVGQPVATINLTAEAVGGVRVATLANGNWVAVWSETAVNNGDIRYQVYSPAGAPVSGSLFAAVGSNSQHSPDVVALPDGGFVIVWDDDTTGELLARRFSADGTGDGFLFTVATGADSVPDVAVTGDGRILFTWKDGETSEIFVSIWDPREGVINAADYQMDARNFVNCRNVTSRPMGATLDANDTAFANLSGGEGNDILIGNGNHDLTGSFGNDIYFVNHADVSVSEAANQGDDTIYASVSYAINSFFGGSVETLAASNQAATTAINLTGLDTAQSIFGNEGNNQLLGLGGNDQLVGYGGNDVLVGGGGIDYLRGGLGNDVYGIGEGDVILENAGEGDDSLAADIGSYFLNDSASIETLSTANQAGTFAQNLTGNEIGQTVAGSEGANVLNGMGGIDLLRGYGGADIFLFDTAPGANNHDVIADMAVGVDRIALQNSVFTGLAEGNLGANAFRTGAAAQDADDRIIWNAATNQLFFDADGNGAGAAILFAIVNGSPNLQATDFIIV